MNEEELDAHKRKMLRFALAYGIGEKRRKEMISNANQKQSAESVSAPQVRTQVDDQASLRRKHEGEAGTRKRQQE